MIACGYACIHVYMHAQRSPLVCMVGYCSLHDYTQAASLSLYYIYIYIYTLIYLCIQKERERERERETYEPP